MTEPVLPLPPEVAASLPCGLRAFLVLHCAVTSRQALEVLDRLAASEGDPAGLPPCVTRAMIEEAQHRLRGLVDEILPEGVAAFVAPPLGVPLFLPPVPEVPVSEVPVSDFPDPSFPDPPAPLPPDGAQDD